MVLFCILWFIVFFRFASSKNLFLIWSCEEKLGAESGPLLVSLASTCLGSMDETQTVTQNSNGELCFYVVVLWSLAVSSLTSKMAYVKGNQ